MKRVMSLIIGVLLLAGCSNQPNLETNTSQNTSDTIEQVPNQERPQIDSKTYAETIKKKSEEITKDLENIIKNGEKNVTKYYENIKKNIKDIKNLDIPNEYKKVGEDFKETLVEFEILVDDLKSSKGEADIKDLAGLLSGYFAQIKETIQSIN